MSNRTFCYCCFLKKKKRTSLQAGSQIIQTGSSRSLAQADHKNDSKPEVHSQLYEFKDCPQSKNKYAPVQKKIQKAQEKKKSRSEAALQGQRMYSK